MFKLLESGADILGMLKPPRGRCGAGWVGGGLLCAVVWVGLWEHDIGKVPVQCCNAVPMVVYAVCAWWALNMCVVNIGRVMAFVLLMAGCGMGGAHHATCGISGYAT